MTQFTITLIDTTGKQNYIFNTNRLRENIGASFLLSQATKEWVEDILESSFEIPKNLQKDPIDTSRLDAEIIYANGGNALIVFKSREIAVKFTRILSKKVLTEASGVNLLVAHADFDWDKDNLYEIVEDLKKNEIEHQKYERIHSAPLLGLGVTASCNSTQLPAVDRSDKHIDYDDDEAADSYLISTETRQKLKSVRKANQELQQIFSKIVDENIYKFPYRIDNLGRSEGESSYVAVVHIDGNGMGDRFKNYGEVNKNKNRNYINAMREFSESVCIAGKTALETMTQILIINAIKLGRVVGKIGAFNLERNSKSNIFYLPLRPLVYAGDDITFLCEGRLGLDLAALFLQKFEEQKVRDGKPLTACAGVCVVKSHYPFARAYKMSEDLCKSAKQFVKTTRQKDGADYFSAIDWHFAASGLLGSVSEIRQREYRINDKTWHLEMRPLWLESQREWRTWSGFTQVIKEFKQGDEWKERKNKIMALREVLRKGSIEAVEQFLLTYKLPNLPSFPNSSGKNETMIKQGWVDSVCGYFDAIEAMDFYLGIGDN